ncbi:MAG: hypothetical protein IJX72_07600 [Clostridia bacterium]|nr:hypothetical protein [Clostridia bacterium]
MNEQMLFYTAIPILIGGSPRKAGRLAASLYAKHGVTPHWFGHGWHPLLSIYAERHPVSLPQTEANDRIWVQLLCGFEKQQRHTGGIPCLIPCSKENRLFLERAKDLLEERFVILDHSEWGDDPLYGLVHSH